MAGLSPSRRKGSTIGDFDKKGSYSISLTLGCIILTPEAILQRFILRMVSLVVFTEYQFHLQSDALRSCSEGQNFLFPCWNSILSFLLQMFRLTRPPEAQIRTNLRPSVASVGLSFLGITLWNIPPHDLSGHGTEEHVAGRAEEHDVDYINIIFSYRK